MTKRKFQHLHLHSYFSMMWGTAPPDILARTLIANGQPSFPLTDRNGLHGMIEHLRVCQTYGLKPVIGCELVTDRYQVLALVKTQRGYANLCAMLTQFYRDPKWQLDQALLDRHHGLVLITQSETLLRTLSPEAELYVDLHPGAVEQAVRLHRRLKLPMVVTSHVYTISPKAYPLHLLLRAIDSNSKLSRLPRNQCLTQDCCFYPNRDMETRFAAYPEALAATSDIADACEYAPKLGSLIFPPAMDEKPFRVLKQKTYAGIARRYGTGANTALKRADDELDIIRRKSFSNCFLVIEDVVSRFSLTCGRGSAAASIVSYALGITHVDPIAHNLFFERFLNPGRADPPDIDIDFAWDERDRVRDYLWQKYGRSHIAMVCNHNRLRARSAVREIAKVYGLGERELREMSHRLIKSQKTDAKPSLPPPWPAILNMAKRIENYPRHISVHCGGVVITPDVITNHCPLKPMPIGYDVIPWEKDGAEDYGFVKLDFLGNRSLAVIRDTLATIRKNYNVNIAYESLNPLEDIQTTKLISSGNTMGCFYIESPATRQLLQKVAMGDYETLVAVSSIIRPAANTTAREWIQRHRWMADKNHQRNWNLIHPKLEEVLAETHGLMVYQEDLTKVAMALAGFTAVEGDTLRKLMGKSGVEKQLHEVHKKFRKGCKKNGLSGHQVEQIWAMVQSFQGYSFCKPHSASYALVSFKSAFLKFHYPAEFMAAVISNRGGFYSPFAYLSHARRLGLRVLGPHINDSDIAYRGYRGRIQVGLGQIKGIKKESLAELIEARKHGSFHDLNDFLRRTDMGSEEVKRLILSGCFDELEAGKNRPTLIWQLLHWQARHSGQAEDLFPELVREEDIPKMAPYTEKTKLILEKKLLGFFVSRHPLERYAARIKRLSRIAANDLCRHVNRLVVLAGWLITGKTVTTKHQQPMSFLTFEDETGLYETVMFPDLFKKRAHMLNYAQGYLVHGQVVSDMGSLSVELTDVQRLDP